MALFLKNLLKMNFSYVKISLIYVKDGISMTITDVRVRLVKREEGKLKAVASVTFDDCFVVHDIKIIEGSEGYFIAMPSKKTGEGEYKDIAHPIKTETREQLIKVILAAFEEEKAKPQD
jgi:stage V sporulation protein G